LLEKEKYGEAVTGIEVLEAEQGQGPEIAALKEQAVEKFIQEERNRAAKMFLMARQTEDKKKKAEYLRGSLNILKNLVEKYPSSTLITKINSNIKSVEDEMTRLGIH
jgi:outer membrane protein assembly factor BamD (BamD/ComL family)